MFLGLKTLSWQFSFSGSDTFISYQKSLRENFVFHSNLSIKQKVVTKFPKFYQKRCEKYLSSPPKFLSTVASQFIWYCEYIKIDNKTIIYYCYFSQNNLNHIGDHFKNNGNMKG